MLRITLDVKFRFAFFDIAKFRKQKTFPFLLPVKPQILWLVSRNGVNLLVEVIAQDAENPL
jgi:hypothetical protein